jgi:transposase
MRMVCMTSWTDESLFSNDLRGKIVDAIERGRPKAQAARTFGVGISTVKRYAAKAQKGEPLEPGKAPGKPPKIDERINKLLVQDLQERPFVTLRERCECVEAISGVSVSRSTMCRTIARIGSTRKKGGRTATERDEFLRAAWRSMVAAEVDPSRMVFVDEMGLHTSLAPLYGYAPKGERVRLEVPRNLKARTPPFWPPSP